MKKRNFLSVSLVIIIIVIGFSPFYNNLFFVSNAVCSAPCVISVNNGSSTQGDCSLTGVSIGDSIIVAYVIESTSSYQGIPSFTAGSTITSFTTISSKEFDSYAAGTVLQYADMGILYATASTTSISETTSNSNYGLVCYDVTPVTSSPTIGFVLVSQSGTQITPIVLSSNVIPSSSPNLGINLGYVNEYCNACSGYLVGTQGGFTGTLLGAHTDAASGYTSSSITGTGTNSPISWNQGTGTCNFDSFNANCGYGDICAIFYASPPAITTTTMTQTITGWVFPNFVAGDASYSWFLGLIALLGPIAFLDTFLLIDKKTGKIDSGNMLFLTLAGLFIGSIIGVGLSILPLPSPFITGVLLVLYLWKGRGI